MHHTNVNLSENELALANNKDIILTKNRIIAKVYEMFGVLSGDYISSAGAYNNLPEEIFKTSAKIYKGEQYKGLPYVMLDYPRYFLKDEAMAIRNFFWWGNFFSITLHLSGSYRQRYAGKVLNRLYNNSETEQWFFCTGDTEWEHHFDADNYQPVSLLRSNESETLGLPEKKFFKLSKKIPLEKWGDAMNFFKTGYHQILQMLND